MNLIDHAARELARLEAGGHNWDILDELAQDKFRNAVRVVLDALRDPDQLMEEAGAEIIRNVGRAEAETAYRNDAANTWRFMIEALLGERSR